MVVVAWNKDHHIKVGSHQTKKSGAASSGLGGRWKDEKDVHIYFIDNGMLLETEANGHTDHNFEYCIGDFTLFLGGMYGIYLVEGDIESNHIFKY